MVRSLFVTGASGFIGRTLLARFRPQRYDHVSCLTRNESAAANLVENDYLNWLIGSIFDSSVYGSCLESTDLVIHLAATTGKARREEYFRVNSAGTRYLLAQCKQRGVKHFLYVSTIAVKYGNKSHYYYAQSKQEGEEAVTQSGLNYTILRPTIVLGKDSPGWNALSGLARLPLVPVLGDGSTRIQPIDVDDVVDAILAIIEEQDFCNATYDFGGPEIITIEEFLRKISRFYRGSEPRIMHLPQKPLRWIVACAESVLPGLMPLNAGQLSVFVQDGSVAPNRLYEKQRPRMKDLDTVLRSLTRNEGTDAR